MIANMIECNPNDPNVGDYILKMLESAGFLPPLHNLGCLPGLLDNGWEDEDD